MTHSLSKLTDDELLVIIKKGEMLAGSEVDDIVELVPDYKE